MLFMYEYRVHGGLRARDPHKRDTSLSERSSLRENARSRVNIKITKSMGDHLAKIGQIIQQGASSSSTLCAGSRICGVTSGMDLTFDFHPFVLFIPGGSPISSIVLKFLSLCGATSRVLANSNYRGSRSSCSHRTRQCSQKNIT